MNSSQYLIAIDSNIAGAIGMLERLGPEVVNKVLPKACRAGATPQAKAARAFLRKVTKKRTGLLGRSLAIRTVRKQGRVLAVVLPRKGFGGITAQGKKVYPLKYSHLVELGHRIALGPSGRSENFFVLKHSRRNKFYGLPATVGGFVKPRPFLKPAFDSTTVAALVQFAFKVRSELRKVSEQIKGK